MPEVGVITPVKPECDVKLRTLLRELRVGGAGPTPFRIHPPRTHFARFVVIDVGGPHLLFTSKFDGDERSYLAHIASVDAARKIYALCVEPRDPATELCDYLQNKLSARLPRGYIVPEQRPADTVERVNKAIDLSAELRRFATRAETLDAVDLAHAFRNLGSVRKVLEG